jgi:archaellum component FlaC
VSDNLESLVLEQLRRLNQRFDRFELENLDVKMRLSSIDEHLAGMMMSISGINSRLDRLEERVGRIERRLDLTDVPNAR